MKKNRHTDEQIVKILREANETSIAATARKHAITEQTIYRWRKLYDGMQANDVKELKALRDENQRLKKRKRPIAHILISHQHGTAVC